MNDQLDAAINPNAIATLRRFGGERLARELASLFVEHAPVRLSAARAALDGGDAGGVCAALHALKSSAGQMGAVHMQTLCADGEARSRAGSLEGMGTLLDQLDAELPRVRAALDTVAKGDTA